MLNEQVVTKRKSWAYWVVMTSIFWFIAFGACILVSIFLTLSNSNIQELVKSEFEKSLGVEVTELDEETITKIEFLEEKVRSLEAEKKELELREEIREEERKKLEEEFEEKNTITEEATKPDPSEADMPTDIN